MDERLNGHGYAKAAFDIAFLDLLDQRLGVPVSILLYEAANRMRRSLTFGNHPENCILFVLIVCII